MYQRRSRSLIALITAAAMTIFLGAAVHARNPESPGCGLTLPINNNDTVVLRGNVPSLARPANDFGAVDPAMPMQRMILTLKISPSKKAKLDRLLREQQDPTSPLYHHWLTPREFGRRFGPSSGDLAVVKHWLRSQGFAVDSVANGRMWINFSGMTADVERAFHTQIHNYLVHGVMYDANATDISIPRALSPVVAGIVSLNDFPLKAMNTGFHKLSPADAAAVAAKAGGIQSEWSGTANGTSGVYTSPLDWATIYDANASYSANGTGTGVTIGIVGRTNPGTTNWATFRSVLGLPANTPTIIVNGTNPGDLGAGEDGEADLDAEWSGGVAPGATVKFVASKSTSSTDGVDLSAQYIVDNNIADVMSTSFGQCESSMGTSENNFYNNLWSQAASEGITACVSTGDSGPAGCTGGSSTSGSGYSGVNGLASTPYDIAVGATQLSTSSSYWNASGDAVSYIPETPWNESGTVSGGSGLWSTSSGASSTYAKPSWQSAPGVPSADHRYLPDVCLDGSDMFFGNYGMLVYTQGAMATTGGTSAASPSFAGVMALVVQKYGRQGNANTVLYQLGTTQYGSSGPAVFHDITSGNNNVPGLTGFTATTAWDEVTGLGTVDVDALVNDWSGSSSTYSISGTVTYNGSGLSGVTVTAGSASTTTNGSGAYTITGLANGTYTVTPSLSGYTFSPANQSVSVSSANVTGIDFTASGGTVTYSISGTVTAGGSGLSGVTVSAGSASATTSSSGAYTISGLANATYTVTPTLSGYTFSPSTQSVVINGANQTGINFAGTATPPPTGVQNGGFETGNLTNWTAGTGSGTVAPAVSTAQKHSGSYSAYLAGSVSGSVTTSSIYQDVTVPAGGGTLSFWYYPVSPDTITYDWQEMDILNTSGTVLATPLKVCSNAQTWTQVTYDLSSYAGQTIRLKFTDRDDGYSGDQTNMYVDDVTIIPPATTYSISGTVTLNGSGLSGVTVTAGSASATTNGAGAYTLTGLANGTYTVTPGLSGYTFTPASSSETVNGANLSGVNFTATANPPATYSISGTVTLNGSGLYGVTVTAGSASATTNSAGAYTLTGLANGTYTVTPSLSGYTFTPASASETVNGANISGVNFTAATNGGGGGTTTLFSNGFESASGWSSSQVSGSAGAWSIVGSGSYPSVSPHGGSKLADFNSYTSRSGNETRYYNTTAFSVPSNTTSATLTFWMYHDTGYSSSNDRVQAQVSTNGGSSWTNIGSAVSRYDGSTGWAQATVDLTSLAGQSNVLIGFVGISAYGNDCYIDDVSVVAQTGAPLPTYSISGAITYNGSGLSGVTVAAGSATATTNTSGAYTLSGLTDGTYSVTASLSGYTFTPASASETVNGANITGVNFTAAVASGPTTLFSDGFENGGWSTAQVSGSQGAWNIASSGSYPSVSPHGGSKLADFNSYTSNSGNATRIYRTSGFAVSSSYSSVTLTFWMYHDTGYSYANDKVQVQVSTNGTTWTNAGSAVSRYDGSTGWAQSTVDLSAFKGQTVYLAFVGTSAYGNDCYIDDVTVVGQ